jgi:hypothetical protein
MDFVQRLREKEKERQNSIEANENGVADLQEDAVSSDFFGTDNLRNLPACLDLRLSETKRRALPYSYIMEVLFDATDGIEIIATTKRIKITGRNLGLLFDYLVAFRVRFIKMHSGSDFGVDDGGLFVGEILFDES